jgi:hypothetical protein
MSIELERESRAGVWVLLGSAWALSFSREGIWPGIPAILIVALVNWRPAGLLPRAVLPIGVGLSIAIALWQSLLLGEDSMLSLTSFLMGLQWTFYLVERDERENAHVLWLNLVHMGVVASYGADLWFAPISLMVCASFLASLSQRRLRRAADGRVVAGATTTPGSLILRPMALSIFASLALFFAFLSFLFLPRSQWPIWAGFKRSPLMVGFSERVDLTRSGRLRLDHQVVMRVEPLDAIEIHPDDSYLRGWVYDLYQDQRWLRAFPAWSGDIDRHEDGFLGPPAAIQITRVQRHRITVEGMRSGVVFSPGVIRGVRWLSEPAPKSLRFGLHNAIIPEFPYGPGTKYELACWMGVDQPALPGPVAKIQIQRALNLPSHLPAAMLLELASQLCGPDWSSISDPRLKAQQLADALARNYRYSLDLSDPGPRDPVLHFLTISHSGHCELFASAFTLLMRAAEVPARLVNGFRLVEWSPELNCWLVRQSHAHAWVEIYVDDDSWARVDPTPEASAGGPQQRSWISLFDDFYSRHVLGFSSHDQASLWARLKSLIHELRSVDGIPTLGGGWGSYLSVLAALALLLVLSLRLLRPRARVARSADRLRSTSALRRLLARLSKLGAARNRRETLTQYARRLDARYGLSLRDSFERYERLRFGPEVANRDALDEALALELGQLAKNMKAQVEAARPVPQSSER